MVRTLILDQVVNIYTDFTGLGFGVIDAHHNPGGIHIVDHTATGGGDHRARVNGGHTLDACADKGFFWAQNRHSLSLHVGTHQSAVGVIVLQEGHQRCRHRNNLGGGHVHVLNALGPDQNGLAFFTGRHQFVGQATFFVQGSIGLGNHIFAFFDGRQIVDVHRDLAFNHLTVRRFNEAVLVQAGIQSQGVDQSNVGTFRRFNGAHATVVGDVHIAHFKASTFAGQTAWAQG